MAESSHDMLIIAKYIGSTATHNFRIISDFGFVLTDSNESPYQYTSKEIEATSWADEDGENAYIPATLREEAYDIDVYIATTNADGTTTKNKYEKLKALLKSGTAGGSQTLQNKFDIIIPWSNSMHKGCYLKSIETKDYFNDGKFELLELKLKFRVTMN